MDSIQLIAELLKESPWASLLLFGSGALITYFIAKLQSIKELAKAGLDNNLKQLELLEKLFRVDEEIRAHLLSIRARLRAWRSLMAAGEKEKAIELREEIFEEFIVKYVGAYYRYFNFARWIYSNRKKELMDEDLFPFLQNCRLTIEQYLNFPLYLEKLKQEPLEIEFSNFDFATNYIERNVWWWDKERKAKVRAYKTYFLSVNPESFTEGLSKDQRNKVYLNQKILNLAATAI